jgi:hypothetical protein
MGKRIQWVTPDYTAERGAGRATVRPGAAEQSSAGVYFHYQECWRLLAAEALSSRNTSTIAVGVVDPLCQRRFAIRPNL